MFARRGSDHWLPWTRDPPAVRIRAWASEPTGPFGEPSTTLGACVGHAGVDRRFHPATPDRAADAGAGSAPP